MSVEIVIPLDVNNFSKHKLVVQAERDWKNCALSYDGNVVIRKLGKAVIKDDNEKEVTAVLSVNFIQQAYFVKLDNQTLPLVPQFRWHELTWIWITFPLIFIGGAMGGVIVSLAGMINTTLYRKLYAASAFKRYLVTGVISSLAIVLYVVLGTFVYCWLHPDKCQHF